ncbi:curved DNA-binding protein [Verrucomicrobium sp. GAS474]|uniref:DnaJ C-terminal domain-containing protein n=1 Tax=Verrucomicrobium sp. GAS474 TaxID=1882831 RepID=UPI00087DC3D1|nr:DnaJ C-terminal domain-containing protein [Verrucomicrobium sp. GAS474]SDU23931.1 curved DNA-binding protein [Verrucomicrobium sp. GAS474]
MATVAFNYYVRLGLVSSASQDDIRKAYRQLARIYHPDVAVNKAMAEEVFKQLQEAYSTLSDAELRRDYDLRMKDERSRFSFRTSNPRPAAATPPPPAPAPVPKARKKKAAESFDGGPQPVHRNDLDIESSLEITLEDAIHGATYVISIDQKDATTRRQTIHSCRVEIPANVYSGQRIRLRGLGYTDRYRNAAGDLFLEIAFARHLRFRLMGDNLLTDLTLTPWEAALGGRVRVPTLDGTADLYIPAGTQPGQRFTLVGHGVPKAGGNGDRGLLYATVKLHVPTAASAKEKELWQALARQQYKQ